MVVIVSSVLFFRTPVSPVNALGINWFTPAEIDMKVCLIIIFISVLIFLLCFNLGVGTGIALAGVFLYSRVKGIKSKPKTAWVSTGKWINRLLLDINTPIGSDFA